MDIMSGAKENTRRWVGITSAHFISTSYLGLVSASDHEWQKCGSLSVILDCPLLYAN